MYVMEVLNVHIAANDLSEYRSQIPQALRSLIDEPGVRHVAFVGEEDNSALTMILLVWESREIADAWTGGPRYRTFLENVRPYLDGDVLVTFFSLEGVGFNYDYPFNPEYDQVEEIELVENEQEANQ